MTFRILFAWLLAFTTPYAQPVETHLLDPLAVVSRDGNSGETHRYAVDLDEGDFFELAVSQDKGDVGMVVMGSNGVTVRQINMIDLPPLDERMMLVASETGRHIVEVTFERASSLQRYTLRVLSVRAATDTDRERDRCFTVMAEGDRLVHIERLDSLRQGIAMFQQAASCWQSVNDRDLEVVAQTSLGSGAALFSELSAAGIAAFDRLATLHHESGNRAQELASLQQLINEYADQGRHDRALETALRAHTVAVAIGSREGEARTLHNIGLASFLVGDYQRARASTSAALDLAAALDDAPTQSAASATLARLDQLAGDLDAARFRYEDSLRLASGDRFRTAFALLHLGLLHLQRGDYDQAEQRLNERLAMGPTAVQREQEALASIGLGDIQMQRGRREEGIKLYTSAWELLSRSPGVHTCVAEERLGRLELEDGRLDEAAARFDRMMAIGERTGYSPCLAQAHGAKADFAVRRGDLGAAHDDAMRAVELNERFREAVPSLESRALGFGAIAPAFERAVDINMQRAARGDRDAVARAFELNERSLARALLDQVSEAALDGDAPIPGELAAERQRVREQWRARLAELQIATRSPASKDRADALLSEITSLEVRARDLETKADASDTRRPALLRPQPLDLARIQALLDDETQLLEYAIGERQSYAWVISAKGVRAFTLASRAEITGAARAVHEDLASASTASLPAARDRRQALARLVLGPVATALTARRLVIVATGPLALVPFGALPALSEPGGAGQVEGPAPSDGGKTAGVEGSAPERSPVSSLLSRYEIVQVPSATTLSAMRTLNARRSPATKTAAVLADPIFESDDPRVQAVQLTTATARRGAPAPVRSFPRLPFSRMEARTIAAMLPGEVTMLTDGDATRARVIGDALADYRVIHFATHGVVHPEIASLSSIVLSAIDRNGTPQDPFVRLSDIYEMRLSADVVVLSACSTAMGKNVPGEGPIGLARAFMYAGAPRVVASLWQVNDNATAELMKRFYQGMLIDRLTPAAALRRAQQQLAAMPRWASPYYWAPFVLQGDWQ